MKAVGALTGLALGIAIGSGSLIGSSAAFAEPPLPETFNGPLSASQPAPSSDVGQAHMRTGTSLPPRKAQSARRKSTKASAHAKVGKATGAPHATEASAPIDPSHAAEAEQKGRKSVLPAQDPIDFGMKWNGNNDTAEKTRVQNYGGAAEGTGAEVGLKLHF